MNAITVDIVPVSALSADDKAAWLAMRAQNPALYSPYFHIDYTALVAQLRDDVFVLVARDTSGPCAFLPFQGGNAFAVPVGAPMTDYHGFITQTESELDFDNLLRKAGLGAFHFSAMIDSPTAQRHGQHQLQAAMIALPQGGEAWRAQQDSSYRRSLKSLRRRIRNTEADFGERRFVYHSQSREIFDTLIEWKRQKFAETGKYDVLSAGWTLPLLEDLWARGKEAELRCDLHALYFGDELAAIDLGLSDGKTFHSWMVAYNSEMSNLAPGIQLLEGLIDESENLGYNRIDLGSGIEGYKRYYATEDVFTTSGFVAVKGPAATLSKLYGAAEKFGEKKLADIPGKLRRRYSQIAACEDTLSGRTKAMIDAVKTAKRA